jgi:uncharacterized protein (TIGR02453 family)
VSGVTLGIPRDAVAFFAELEDNNERSWWTANQDRWKRSVREPMQAVCDALADEFGEAKLFRPHRDVRFSADKSPYKTHQGAVVGTTPGVGYYVQVSSQGLMTGAGWYLPMPAQVVAFRDAVLDDDAGEELAAIVDQLSALGIEIDGDRLKSAPRGVDPAHPRIALLRHKTLLASTAHGTPAWMDGADVAENVREDWRGYRPLIDWLDENLVAAQSPGFGSSIRT